MTDYLDAPGAPGFYVSPQHPGQRFRFDPRTLGMVPAPGPANAEAREERGMQVLDADRALEQLPFGERLRLLVQMGLTELREDQWRPLLEAIGDAPGEKSAFYSWAKQQGVCDPQRKDGWLPYLEKFRHRAANAPVRARIGKRKPAPMRAANGLLDDFLQYMAAGTSGASGGAVTAPAPSPFAGLFGAAAPSTPQATSLSSAFEGQLLQAEGDPRVYVIQGGLKQWVNSAPVMQNRFNSQLINGHWTGVNYVTPTVLSSFADGPVITA